MSWEDAVERSLRRLENKQDATYEAIHQLQVSVENRVAKLESETSFIQGHLKIATGFFLSVVLGLAVWWLTEGPKYIIVQDKPPVVEQRPAKRVK